MEENKISLSFNGNEVICDPNKTILEVARENAIPIPTLCDCKNLSPFGACRLCLVEVEGIPKLATACSTIAIEGMKIRTESDKINKSRKLIIELLLSDHPLDCMFCEKSGDCLLENLAYEYGLRGDRLSGEKRAKFIDDTNPFIERDNSKCILCGRCVRICDEVQGVGAISFVDRGFQTRIGTPFDRKLDCEFCGQCISVCPVGALTAKPSKQKGRTWQTELTKTICPYCGCGCNLSLHIKDNEIIKVTSEETSLNEGYLCSKGRFGYGFVHHQDRLQYPLIKENGKFIETTWEEVLPYVAQRLQVLKSNYGNDSLAGLSSAKCTNEENYLFQKFIRAVLGTNNVDHCARL